MVCILKQNKMKEWLGLYTWLSQKVIGEPFDNSFMSSPRCCTFLSIFTKLFIVLPLWKPCKYLSGIVNCPYIPQNHFHLFRYTVHGPLFFREIVDVDRWPVGRGGGVIIRHVELHDRHLRSRGKIGD